MTSLPEPLIRDNLYNWFGFGNTNSRYWFIGREEYDSIVQCDYLDDLRDYYEARRNFDFAEDFVETWEGVYGRSVSAGTTSATTRHYQAAFLLALEGTSPRGRNPESGRSKTASYLFSEQKFGRSDGNHFSGEVFPLRYHPEKPTTFDPYRDVWESPEAYEAEVLPHRIGFILEQIRSNPNVEVIISYAESTEFVEPVSERLDVEFLARRDANKRNDFAIYRCRLSDERSVLLIDSPFLGQGHVGYDEIEALAAEIHDGF